MKKAQELVSVIMPAYNCAKYIGKTIDSVISQTYDNWEIIIVDDASIDNTEEILREYIEKDTRIIYFKLKENSGPAIARNKAIELAKGKYLAFLDSDDIWFSKKLEKQINFMKVNKYSFTCTSYSKIDESGNDLARTIEAIEKRNYDGLLKTCPGNSTVIYDANKLGKFQIVDIKKRNDYVLWLQVIKKAKILYGLKDTLGSHRIRSEAISKNKFSLVSYHWKVYREIERLSFFKSTYLIFYWVISTVLKLR